MNENGEEIVRVDGNALEALVTLGHSVEGETQNRAIDTQFDRGILHILIDCVEKN